MNYLPGVLVSYTIFLMAIASPGPNVLAIMGTSMANGRRYGIAMALGVSAGSLSWALMTVFGLSAILSTYASFLIAIKIFGGFYLLWLAYKSFRSAASEHDLDIPGKAGNQMSGFSYMKRGYLIMMTNPKAVLAWIAIVSLGLKEGAPWWVGAMIVGGITVMSVTIHLLYALVFSTSPLIRLYSSARRRLQVTLGVFFAFAGFRLLTDR